MTEGQDGWMASPTQWKEFDQTPGDGEGQGSLACCSSWGHRVGHDLETEQQQFSGDNSSLGRLNAEKFSSNPSCTVFRRNSFWL